MRRPEQDLQRQVVAWLNIALPRTAWFCHIPNGGYRSIAEGAIMKGMGVRAGAPDLLIVHQGRAHFIEMKAPGKANDATALQQGCHVDLFEAGAPTRICDSLESVQAALEGWGIPMKVKMARAA